MRLELDGLQPRAGASFQLAAGLHRIDVAAINWWAGGLVAVQDMMGQPLCPPFRRNHATGLDLPSGLLVCIYVENIEGLTLTIS